MRATNKIFDYREYLRSPEWRVKSEAMKWMAGYRCQICNRHKSEVILNTYHRTYARIGDEIPSDLTVLCEGCHKLFERARAEALKAAEEKLAKDKVKEETRLAQAEASAAMTDDEKREMLRKNFADALARQRTKNPTNHGRT